MTTRLHGRSAECLAIDELLATAADGRGAVLAFVGEPGIGKSALLEYGAHRAAAGARVLVGRGVRSERDLPFGVLDMLLRPVDLDPLDLPVPQRAALAAALATADLPTGGVDRFAVGAGLLTVLTTLARDRPVVAVLDDVQWIDEPSLAALGFVARRLAHDAVALLFAGRGADGVRDLPRIDLAGLDGPATTDLLAERGIPVPPDRVDRLVALTGGNPLALVDLPGLAPDLIDGPAEPLPIGIVLADAYGERIDRLPAATRRALLVTALLHDADTATLFAALASDGADGTVLAAAEDAGLVTVTPAGVRFRHPLVRSACVQRVPHSDRRAAHAVIAGALADDASVHGRARRAWHLASAAYGLDESAAAALHETADRAVLASGYASASAAYERAAQLSAGPEVRAGRLFAAAAAAFNAGRTDRSARLLAAARAAAPAAEEIRAEVEALLGRVQTRSGDTGATFDRLVAEADRVRGHRPDLAVKILAAAFGAAVYSGRGHDALAVIHEATALIADDPGPLAVYCRCAAIIVRTLLGEATDAKELDHELVGSTLDGDLPAEALPLIADMAYGYAVLDAFDRATELHDRLKRIARERSAVGLMVWPIGEQALVDFRRGHWREAYAGILEAEQLAIDTGLVNEIANTRHLRAGIAAARGHRTECVRYANLVLEQSRASGTVVLDLLVQGLLGGLELGLGRPDAALAPLETARRLATETGFQEAMHFPWAADLVEAYVHCGRTADAEPVVEALEAQAALTGRPLTGALAARCRGLVDPLFADHFEEALSLHECAGRPFETARTRLAYGQRLRRQRSRAEARTQLRAAWETFAALGAEGWAERAHRELRATGVELPARLHRGADLLTPQELQVALVVETGASNRQTAERLFVSTKTVEYHLSHVYRKLGITSRADLGAALETTRVRP
ncbi:AAA family ATPase [Virgisporangium aurantiacum]|uniref:Transcriptional regulator n=1 Tax=Virgisporangium aurantiacum TaxID=175570 RepID=A0A8J3Z3V3_9ACTN|nr:LuxR family transcriptional regulator [Virgisporangium aurantiacum]GIJ54533.1 transcriptional regulator [Virgisporangium aurantiacum]